MAEALLSLEIESLRYEGSERDALKDLSLTLMPGKSYVLTGLSGCGKSSLIRAITGLIPTVYPGELKGQISLKGKPVEAYAPGTLFQQLSYVFQDPASQFYATIVEDELALVGEQLGMPRERLLERIEDVCQQLDLSALRRKHIFDLSGGEKQRVCIAAALIYDTDLLLFDEPSASLDADATAKLANILSQLKARGKTLLIVEHRLSYLYELCDELIVMEEGRIQGQYTQDHMTEGLEKQLGLRQFTPRPLKASAAPLAPEAPVLLSLQDLQITRKGFAYPHPVHCQLKEGEVMAVIGRNGVGKSTFMAQLSGLLPLKGHCSFGRSKRQRLRQSSSLVQDLDCQIFFDKVENELIHSDLGQRDIRALKPLLLSIDLWEKRTHHPQTLSMGEKQRLMLSVILSQDAKLALVDEPTAGLDYQRMKASAALLQAAAARHPIILVTHDLELIGAVANSILYLGPDGVEHFPLHGHEAKVQAILSPMDAE